MFACETILKNSNIATLEMCKIIEESFNYVCS